MTDNVVSRATAALAQSVGSIIGSNDDDATKHSALAESFEQFQTYLLDRNGGGSKDDSVGKADHHASVVANLLRSRAVPRPERRAPSLTAQAGRFGVVVAPAQGDQNRKGSQSGYSSRDHEIRWNWPHVRCHRGQGLNHYHRARPRRSRFGCSSRSVPGVVGVTGYLGPQRLPGALANLK
jgi:hypothetical protein